MPDLKSPALIKLKVLLFILTGLLSSALLLFDAPSVRNLALLAISIWSFCRAYYFAFYVSSTTSIPGSASRESCPLSGISAGKIRGDKRMSGTFWRSRQRSATKTPCAFRLLSSC